MSYESNAICEFCRKGTHELCDDNVDFPCVCCGIEWPPVLTQWDREVKADIESKRDRTSLEAKKGKE